MVMKKIIVTLSLLLIFTTGFSQAFVTTWNTGTDTFITIPGYGTNYNIQWEEIGNASHNGNLLGTNTTIVNFGDTGTYKISINGGNPAFNRINFGTINSSSLEHKKILSVENWGSIVWSSMQNAFVNCTNLISVPYASPNMSSVLSIGNMFYGCTHFNSNISNWDVSNIKYMGGVFLGATSFNQPLNNWNTINVQEMAYMFANAISFNQPLNNWNTSNVITMERMFWNATSFNQFIENWDVSKVTNMSSMFSNSQFNQPIGNWNVSKVTNMSSMFSSSQFNQPIGNWNTSSVTNMYNMFDRDSSFNQAIVNWDVSHVVDMEWMFLGVYLLTNH